MIATATYESDDIRVTFTCQMERADYGVPRSPSWWEPNLYTIEVVDLSILGMTVDPASLSSDLRDAIYGLADGLDWESEV